MAKAKSKKPVTKKQKRGATATASAKHGNSKQDQLIAMLKRQEGATIDEVSKKFEWQPHTVRGAIAGALKKRLKLKVSSEKEEGRGRVYRIAA